MRKELRGQFGSSKQNSVSVAKKIHARQRHAATSKAKRPDFLSDRKTSPGTVLNRVRPIKKRRVSRNLQLARPVLYALKAFLMVSAN